MSDMLCLNGWQILGLTIFVMLIGYFFYTYMIELTKNIKKGEEQK